MLLLFFFFAPKTELELDDNGLWVITEEWEVEKESVKGLSSVADARE